MNHLHAPVEALRISDEECSKLLASDSRAILRIGAAEPRIVGSSVLMCSVLGYSAEELQGKPLGELGAYAESAANRAAVERLRQGGHLRYGDLPLLSRDGIVADFAFYRLGRTSDGSQLIEGLIRNIAAPQESGATALSGAVEPLARKAYRRAFEAAAQRECERSNRYQRRLSLLHVEIDRVIAGNEPVGRRIGDLVLRDFASSCARLLRTSDLVGRTAEAEWLILLPETGSDAAEATARRLARAIEQFEAPVRSGGSRHVSVRVGYATGIGIGLEALQAQARGTLPASDRG